MKLPLLMSCALLGLTATNAFSTVRSGTYYEDTATVQCSSTYHEVCILSFPPTPADKFLMVNRVSCQIAVYDHPLDFAYLSIEGTSRYGFLQNTIAVSNGGSRLSYTFNQEVNFKVGRSKILQVYTEKTGLSTYGYIRCTFTGELSDS